MKNTRNWLTILILPLIFLSNSALAEFDNNRSAVCKKSAGDTIEVFSGENPFKQDADVSRTGDQCSEIPDAYRINIFKFGTCKTDPFTSNDFSSCSYFMDSTTSVPHTIVGVGAPTKLAVTGAIPAGNYAYAFMILSNSLEVKHEQTYDTSMYSNPDGEGITQGTTCWSINYTTTYGGFDPTLRNNGTVLSTGIECGSSSDARADFTKEIFDSMGEGHPEAFVASDDDSFTLPSGDSMRAKLLQSDNVTTATGYANAERIFVRIAFAREKVVKEFSNIEVQFKLTDAVSVDSGWDPDNSRQYIVKMGADPFQMDIVVTP